MTGIKEFEYIKEPKTVDLSDMISTDIAVDDDLKERFFGLAITLHPSYLGFNSDTGWEIYGEIHEDYFEWVNYFEAQNKEKGYIVFGDFEDGFISSNSQEAINDFMLNYPYDVWDYGSV